MKIQIERDERWPFYVLDVKPTDGETINVHPTRVKKWQRVMAEFEKVQHEMGKMLGDDREP